MVAPNFTSLPWTVAPAPTSAWLLMCATLNETATQIVELSPEVEALPSAVAEASVLADDAKVMLPPDKTLRPPPSEASDVLVTTLKSIAAATLMPLLSEVPAFGVLLSPLSLLPASLPPLLPAVLLPWPSSPSALSLTSLPEESEPLAVAPLALALALLVETRCPFAVH